MLCRSQLLLTVVGFFTTLPALADSLAPDTSFKEVAPGGKNVFVMITRVAVEDEVRGWGEENGNPRKI
jgi:hypothetical protein